MIIAAKKIIVGDGKTVLDGSAVYVNDRGRIEKVGKLSELKDLYPDQKVIEYPEHTLLPGLIDVHAHL